MSYRSLFDATIPTEPPSRNTVDSVFARARRRLALRRFVVTAGGFAVVIAATAGGFAVASGPGPSRSPVATSPPSTAAPTPVSTTLLGVEPTEPTAHAIARLETAIPGAIRYAARGIELDGPITVERKNSPASETGDGGIFPATFFYETRAMSIQLGGRRADFTVTLMRRFVDARCTPQDEESRAQALLPTPDPTPEVTCEIWHGRHGERAVIERVAGQPLGSIRTTVWLDRLDGSSVGLHEESIGDPLLADEQLMGIVLDPRVSFYR